MSLLKIQDNFLSYQTDIDKTLAEMQKQRVIERIWNHDHTVWKPEPTEITNRLGWLHTIETMKDNLPRLKALTESVCADGYTHALLLGMGGSSLAPEVFRKTFGVKAGYLDLRVLDSTDPAAILAYVEQLDFSKTLFIVATKSGGTVETLSFFKFFYNRTLKALGSAEAGEHFLAITDPGSKLVEIAQEHNFRDLFLNDPNIGGRYSALSYFGILPATLVGVDVETLLQRALSMATKGAQQNDNDGAHLGAIMGNLALAGRDKITLVASPAIASFGDWVEQLLAESTGKEGQGVLPVVDEPIGDPKSYGKDRLFIYLRLDNDNTHDVGIKNLEDAGHPVVHIALKDVYDLGAQFFLWEMATIVTGHALGINPFDQPNVEEAKILARKMVKEYKEKGALPNVDHTPLTTENLNAFSEKASEGDYIALQAYVRPTPAADAALNALRVHLRDTFHLAVTIGYGPRFLHSTGQLHKGDRGNGLFVQFVSTTPEDLPIPNKTGEPKSSMSFGVLKKAQALGDAQALLNTGRRIIRFEIEQNVVEALRSLH